MPEALEQKRKMAVEATLSFAKVAFVSLHGDKAWPSVAAARADCPQTLQRVEATRAALLGRCDLSTRAALTPRANEVAEHYKASMAMQNAMLKFVFQHAILSPSLEDGGVRQVSSVSEVVAQLKGFINRSIAYVAVTDEMRTRLVRFILGRHAKLTAASEKLHALKRQVEAHVRERHAHARTWLSADSIDSDVLERIISFLGYKSAASCLRACKAFSQMDCIKKMLPHLSVRKTLGSFPHKINGSRNLVARKTTTHLYVDLVVQGALTGDAQRDQWLSSHVRHSDAVLPSQGVRRSRLACEVDRSNRRAREAPEEAMSEGNFRKRIVHESFFSTPIECSVQLVFADTLGVVDECLPDPVLELPRAMRKSNSPVTTYTSLDGSARVPYPAHIAFTINDLSGNYSANKLFKFKVTGRAQTLANEEGDEDSIGTQTLVSYSEPFQIVSKKEATTSCRGAKRKR